MFKRSSRIYIIVILGVINLVTLLPFCFTGLGCMDDLQYDLMVRKNNIWALGESIARDHGRFHFLLVIPYALAPYLTGIEVYKTLNTLLLFSNAVLLGLIARKILNSEWAGYLVFLLFIVFVSAKGMFNPVVCYPIYFTSSFGFILVAVYLALMFAENKSSSYIMSSAIFYLLGLLCYETYIVYLPVIFYVATFYSDRIGGIKEKGILRWLKVLSPFIILLVAYAFLYFIYRYQHPSNYGGSKVSVNFSLLKMMDAAFNFSASTYPLSPAFSSSYLTYGGSDYFLNSSMRNIAENMLMKHPEWIAKAVLCMLVLYTILANVPGISIKKFRGLLCVTLIYILLPHIPLSITEKYQNSGGSYSYVTAYFGFFSVMFTLTLILIFIGSRIHSGFGKAIFITIVLGTVGFSSLVNDYANYHAVDYLKRPKRVFTFMNHFIHSEAFEGLPDQAFIYCPTLINNFSDIRNIIAREYDWSDYFFRHSEKKGLSFSTSKAELFENIEKKSRAVYYMGYNREPQGIDQYIVLAKISKWTGTDTGSTEFCSDSLKLFSFTDKPELMLAFNSTDNISRIADINNIPVSGTGTGFKYLFKKETKDSKIANIKIASRSIDVTSVYVFGTGMPGTVKAEESKVSR